MGWEGSWEGGSGWGTHVNPWLIHVNVWQKPLQYCKVISLQLIKINGKIKIKKIFKLCVPWTVIIWELIINTAESQINTLNQNLHFNKILR